MKKILFLFILAVIVPAAFNANAKCDYYSQKPGEYVFCAGFKKYKHEGSFPKLDISIYEVINFISKSQKSDTIYTVMFCFYTFNTNDASFRAGDEMLVRLANDEVIKGSIYFTAAPKISMSDDGQNVYSELPDRLPGFRVSKTDLEKMSNLGVKKIRLTHSKGYTDFNLDEKQTVEFAKKFSKQLTDLQKYIAKSSPEIINFLKRMSNKTDDSF